MSVVAIIQARTGSTRLPNKIFLKLANKSLLSHVVNRLKPSKEIDHIVIATTTSDSDNVIEEWCLDNYIDFYRGSNTNVLDRYYNAALKFNASIIVRITADDPFKDYRLVDEAITILKTHDYDFVCNNNPVSFPEGLDIEVMTIDILSKAFYNSKSNFEREHVTQYIHKNIHNFKAFNIQNNENLSFLRWTLDTNADYVFATEIYNRLYHPDQMFLTEDILDLLNTHPFLQTINNLENRSEQFKK